MTVISNTSPLSYLTLIDLQDISPSSLRARPDPGGGLARAQLPSGASAGEGLAQHQASWLDRRVVAQISSDLHQLDSGEREAIALARSLDASLVLLDERRGRRMAKGLGLVVSGTLGVLDLAARRGLVDLEDAFSRLEQTTFRATPRLLRHIQEKSSL
jgi:Domain of unknown function (DUF3368)